MRETWSINRLSNETGKDRRTVKKILQEAEPCEWEGEHPLYHLRDFIAALEQKDQDGATALEREKTRLTAKQADREEIALARDRNAVLETETVFRVWEHIATAIRRTVLTSKLTQEEKDQCLNELRTLTINDFLEQREFDQGAVAEAV